jgi:hypothetical protein
MAETVPRLRAMSKAPEDAKAIAERVAATPAGACHAVRRLQRALAAEADVGTFLLAALRQARDALVLLKAWIDSSHVRSLTDFGLLHGATLSDEGRAQGKLAWDGYDAALAAIDALGLP